MIMSTSWTNENTSVSQVCEICAFISMEKGLWYIDYLIREVSLYWVSVSFFVKYQTTDNSETLFKTGHMSVV